MDWRETAAGGLPAPREDEPASLRQDILDEVADHLECALKRELTKNITPDAAIENVKRRFGDPRDLARQLWLDAMKDTIMSKRLTLAAMGLMTVMCFSLGWVAWTSQRASQQAAWNSQRAIEEAHRMNAELVNKLTSLLTARSAPGGSAATERIPVRFHLICDDAQKSPARGYAGTLSLSHGFLNALERTSDENGDLDFGMLPAGNYRIQVKTPWDEFMQIPFEVSSGFPSVSPIVCPARDWQEVEVSMKFDGLPSLKDRDALICCRLAADLNRRVGERGWYWTHPEPSRRDGLPNGFQSGTVEFNVVLDPTGHIVYFDVADGRPKHDRVRNGLTPRPGSDNYFQNLSPTDGFSWLADGLKRGPKLRFYDRNYALKSVTVVLAADIRRWSGAGSEQNKFPQTLLTWQPGWTPFTWGSVPNDMSQPVWPLPVVGRNNVFEIHFLPDFAHRVEKMLLSSASQVPAPANAAQTKTDTAAGAESLKTLGIESALPDRTPEGLTGLRLRSIRDDLPAKRAGLQNGDLLLGVDGWNVNNNRELGWASRGFRPEMRPPQNVETGESSRGAAAPNSLVLLARRGADTRLYEIRPPDWPGPDAAAPSNASPPAKGVR